MHHESSGLNFESHHPQRVLVGITGGIAAYKVCEVVSQLVQQGHEVRVVLTKGATQFVNPLTFATLSRQAAYTDDDFWQFSHGRPLHITLGEWADVILIAPLTANSLAKLAYGMADNLLMNIILASDCPVLLAPAMNTTMWEQETVQVNYRYLQELSRYTYIMPGVGRLACDVVGTGRMAEPATILGYLKSCQQTKGVQDLRGKSVLVSAGGTREFIDLVRFISNPSTGKQGIAIAQSALHRGAQVTLVAANLANPQSPDLAGMEVIPVTTALELQEVMEDRFSQAEITVMCAAVGDVRPQNYIPTKLPKASLPETLPLARVPDIVAQLAKQKQSHQQLIGFAAQSGSTVEIITAAQEKLARKQLDAIVANAVNSNETGFGVDTNQGIFLHRDGRQEITPLVSKLALGHRLWNFLTEGDRD
ncbi:MAG: bifunctional phosphopantothenoylcysteine decarboxylase/phosphopantothenate--cysteine ligase CoaBC [Pseudanabaenaceae cyanobacterium]